MVNATRTDHSDLYWDLIIALRLYLIVLFIILPNVLLNVYLNYIQPLSIIIYGLFALVLIKFVLFEPRKGSKRLIISSLIVLTSLSSLVFLNFFLGFLYHFIHGHPIGIILPLIIWVTSIFYFLVIITKKPFKGINIKLLPYFPSSISNHIANKSD